MWIKICGITRLEDAGAAACFGADAVGFVFAESPRRVTPRRALEIIRGLGREITTVGVFVDEPLSTVLDVVDYCGLDLVQLHGSEGAEYCAAVEGRAIKALRVENAEDLLKANRYDCRAVLLDGYRLSKACGGPAGGKPVDWRMLRVMRHRAPVIVAGGLGPANVAQAVREAMPYGVDVSSGVERGPGIKDPVLMYRFIESARRADYEVRNN